MPRQEQIQPRHQRSRVDTAPSTFPETYKRASGGPGGEGIDEQLIEINEVLADNYRLVHLGHIAVES